jgi:hypothetical protein
VAKITFNLSQTSLSPGWDPNGDGHDSLWQNFAAGYAYNVVGSNTQYDSLRGSDLATGGTSDTFSSAAGSLDLTAHNFAGKVSLDWSDNGDTAMLALDSAWNTIKNAYVSDFSGHKLVLQNWVDAWISLDNDFGQEVRVDGAKRAEIATGSGDDTVWVGVDSNGSGWTNHIDVSTGIGDDHITLTVSTRDYSGTSFSAAYNPHWTTSTIDAGGGADVIAGGGGDDTVDGGTGRDVFVLHGAKAFYQITTVGDVTTVRDVRTGAANQDGIDSLVRVETLQFADQSVALVQHAPPHPIDLGHLGANDGFAILAPDASNSGDAGKTIAAAGDVDGDGFADLILGAPAAGNGSGAAYVVYGHAGGDIDLSSPDAHASLLAASGEIGFGSDVASVGDFNGDGMGDLLIVDDSVGQDFSTAYVVLGQAGGFGASLDVASDPQIYKIAIATPVSADVAFRPLSPPGDVNGDGLADVLLTTNDAATGWHSYLVYGEAGTGGTTTLDHEPPTFPDYTAGVGDVNGDGLADLVHLNRRGVLGEGQQQIDVIYGSADPSQMNIQNFAYAFKLPGNVFDVEGAGDFNGDGLDDIVGAFLPASTDPNQPRLVATVVFSGDPADPLAHTTSILAETNTTSTSYHAVSIGDVNRDGFGDIALTHSGAADAYIVFGSDTPAFTISLDDIANSQGGFKITGDTLGAGGYLDVAGAGDVNGDGVDDIAVGNTAAHAAYVIFGHSDWLV